MNLPFPLPAMLSVKENLAFINRVISLTTLIILENDRRLCEFGPQHLVTIGIPVKVHHPFCY